MSDRDAIIFERDAGRVTPDELAELFESSGIQRPVADRERLARMLANANLIVTARSSSQLVGVARCLSDFAWCCYVSDLAVRRAFQHRGVGRRLLAELQTIVGDECTVILNAAPGAESYYSRVGFEPVASAWKVQRKR